MTKNQAKKITHSMAKHFMSGIDRLGEHTERAWIKRLLPLDFNVATKAADKIAGEVSGRSTFGAMLDLSTFNNYYTDITPPEKPKYCPCCANTGWLSYTDKLSQDKAFRCICRGGKRLDNMCDNLQCQNLKRKTGICNVYV
jgi:hypothetical protein